MSDRVTDHVARAIASLLPDFRDGAKLQALLTAIVEEVQEIEDVVDELVRLRFLTTAIGAQLDQYGVLLNQARNGLLDDEFRAILLVRVLANRSPGTPDTITAIASAALFASDNPVVYQQNEPASYRLEVSPARLGVEINTAANAANIDNEADDTTGWATTNATISSDPVNPFLGAFSLQGVATAVSGAQIEFDFTAVVGRFYRVSFWARRGSPGLDQRISAWVGVDVSPDLPVDSSEWKQFTIFIQATATTITVAIQAAAATGAIGDTVNVDAFSVKELIDLSATLISDARKMLLDATPAGVGLNAIVSVPPDLAFQFGDGTAAEPGGFGSGKLSTILGF